MQTAASHVKVIPITSADGLNLLAASMLARLAKRFMCNIEVAYKGISVNARDVLGVLSLEVLKGALVVVTACGPEASQALPAIERLFMTRPLCDYPRLRMADADSTREAARPHAAKQPGSTP